MASLTSFAYIHELGQALIPSPPPTLSSSLSSTAKPCLACPNFQARILCYSFLSPSSLPTFPVCRLKQLKVGTGLHGGPIQTLHPPSRPHTSLTSSTPSSDLDSTTYQLTITSTDAQWMGNFTSTVHAKNPPAKALLSLDGGGGASPAQPLSPTWLATPLSVPPSSPPPSWSLVSMASTVQYDRLDLDWEFPANAQDMSNLAALFREWRTAFENEAHTSRRPRLLLSAAVYFASNFFLSDVKRAYPADAIRRYVDFVNPMCYDYHGSWDTSATGSHALLYDSTSNISTSYGVQSWIDAGVPLSKLVMGLPMYGRTWKLKDPSANGIGAPAVGGGFQRGQWLRRRCSTKKTVSTYSYAGADWIGYDNATSIRYKVEFARAKNLGGYFFWALGYDKDWTLSKEASRTWDNGN
uniref:GH18 domain-containing protein n=1 Tax=Nelumbo nucifera TaxID=4432 RepID=A0A822Y5Q9_NELNU|nr:TPA_asm: hypothetical protein HUJ06_028821 [Nelumbo nucifera]